MNTLQQIHLEQSTKYPILSKMLGDMRELRKLALKMNSGNIFQNDASTYLELFREIRSVEGKLKTDEIIDNKYIQDILDQCITIRIYFDQLIKNQSIFDTAMDALRDNSYRVVQGEVREVFESKKIIYDQDDSTKSSLDFSKVLEKAMTDIRQSIKKDTSLNSEDTSVHQENPQNERLKIIQKIQFDEKGKPKANDLIMKERQRLLKKLKKIDPSLMDSYKRDMGAANNINFFHNSLDDAFIYELKRDATDKKDGILIQAIKNNLIKHAANDEIFDPNICGSLILADHVKNLSSKNPIIVNTVEFGLCEITSIKTVDYGDEAYYEFCMVGKNGWESFFSIRASAFIVGDLSNKITGRRDPNGKWMQTALPFTIRSIRSTILVKKSENISFKDRTTNFIKNGFNGIKSMFGFGKNKQEKEIV